MTHHNMVHFLALTAVTAHTWLNHPSPLAELDLVKLYSTPIFAGVSSLTPI